MFDINSIRNTTLQGCCLEVLKQFPDESVHSIVTSPPYWMQRKYGVTSHFSEYTYTLFGMPIVCPAWSGELGLEPDPLHFVGHLVMIFEEARRVLRKDGTFWMNLGDCYSGTRKSSGDKSLNSYKQGTNRGSMEYKDLPHTPSTVYMKAKDLAGIPWTVSLALRENGWYLRSDIIWYKKNPMPESVKDRPTKSKEYIFLFSKSKRYFYDQYAIATPYKPKTYTTFGIEQPKKSDQVKAFGHNNDFEVSRDPKDWSKTGKSNRFNEDVSSIKPKKWNTPKGWDTGKGGHGSFHKEGRQKGTQYFEATEGRANARDVWEIASEPFPDAHFATFPRKLPELAIKASTSAKGVCPHCGSPWVRIFLDGVETTDKHSVNSQFIDWSPSCKCADNKPVPAIVLDPFGGSGTTKEVAYNLGRSGIGIELKPEYLDIDKTRMGQHGPLFQNPNSSTADLAKVANRENNEQPKSKNNAITH